MSGFPCFTGRLARNPGLNRSFLATLRRPQGRSSPVQIEICEGEVDDQAMRVRRDTAIADFGKAEDAFDDVKHVFDARTYSRLSVMNLAFTFGKSLTTRGTTHGEVRRMRRFRANDRSLAAVRRVAPDPGLLAVQQFREHAAVVCVRRVATNECGR